MTEFTPEGLIDHILETHHAYMKKELPRLQAMLSQSTSAYGDRHSDVLRPLAAIFTSMKEELDGHLMKEEMVLFPLIRALAVAEKAGSAAPPSHCGSVRNPLRVMLMEHDSAGEALARMRALTAGYTVPEDACHNLPHTLSGTQPTRSGPAPPHSP